MKKIISLLMMICILFTLCGCRNDDYIKGDGRAIFYPCDDKFFAYKIPSFEQNADNVKLGLYFGHRDHLASQEHTESEILEFRKNDLLYVFVSLLAPPISWATYPATSFPAFKKSVILKEYGAEFYTKAYVAWIDGVDGVGTSYNNLVDFLDYPYNTCIVPYSEYVIPVDFFEEPNGAFYLYVWRTTVRLPDVDYGSVEGRTHLGNINYFRIEYEVKDGKVRMSPTGKTYLFTNPFIGYESGFYGSPSGN